MQRYRKYLTQLFGEVTDAQFEQVVGMASILEYEPGQYIFEEGDAENSLYIVLSGRLRALKRTTDGLRILGDIAAGEPVGELALFTNEPRSASVVAIRKSAVLQIEESDYHTLVRDNPGFSYTLTQFVIKRLRLNSNHLRFGSAPKNIAIVKLQPDYDLTPWTQDIYTELTNMQVESRVFYHQGLSVSETQILFEDIEKYEGINLLVCDENHQEWAHQCITYCDLVLVISDFKASSELRPVEEYLDLYQTSILNKKIYLVLLHQANASIPQGTRRWLKERRIDLHLHIRQSHAIDARRFSRIITNRAVGLVLGGGGAKGYAHIGAAHAMIAAGIEFDFVGGTSAGALFGFGLTANDFQKDKLIQLCKMGAAEKPTSGDYHFPFLSLMTGNKMRRFFETIFGETYLEDSWVTTFTVSTNYSTAQLKVHERGLARKQIEASIAIPGIFPPVIINKHLHVDGGVMDNLPIEAMYEKPVRHVIAIALSVQTPHEVEIDTVPSAWTYFTNTFTRKRRFGLPKMASLLVNSLTINSLQKQETTKSEVALYLEMDLRKFGFLDWSKYSELIEQGETQMNAHLKTLPLEQQFWNR